MSFYIHIQETPNPHAVKFISRYTVKTEGSSNYKFPEECGANPLARRLFEVDGVLQVYFFDNYITVTKDPTVDWKTVGDEITEILQAELPEHDPHYKDPVEDRAVVDRTQLAPEILEIEEALDRTIRPALANDGGGIEIVERKGDTVFIRYEGACGSCPSSIGGTLMAIQSILKSEINDNIEVIDVSGGANINWY